MAPNGFRDFPQPEGFRQLMYWRRKHLLRFPEINSDASAVKAPPLHLPLLPQKAIMASEMRGSTPPEMSTSCPSFCCRLLQNESVQFSCTMETAGLRLWPICFPSLLRSAWLNEPVTPSLQGGDQVRPRATITHLRW